MEPCWVLEKSEYFGGLSEQGRCRVAALCRRTTCEKGDVVFFEGQKAESVFLLESGAIQLVKTSVDGKEVVIRAVRPGGVFAELALYGGTYPVTANVTEVSRVHAVPAADFRSLLRDEDFRQDFEVGLIKRIRFLGDRILYLTACDVEERLLRFLRERFGEEDSYTVSMPKKDIAAEIGTIPETLSRLIHRLAKDGEMTWEGHSVRLAPGFWERHARC